MVSICWNLRYWIYWKLGTGLSDLWYRVSGLAVLNRHIIHRWWFEIQDKLKDVNRSIRFANAFEVKPWDRFRVVRAINQRNNNGQTISVTNYNLQTKTNGITYATPKWWNAYNKVKHKRVQSDADGLNYKKANLENLANAFAALYLLEFEFMKDIGSIADRASCGESILFGMGDLERDYIDSLFKDTGNINK